MGTVEAIYVTEASGDEPVAREQVEAVAGRGLRGDRYFDDEGTFSDGHAPGTDDVTLIEAEAIEAVARDYDLTLAPGEHRRNVTTRGVALNHLVGKRFALGDVVCEGVELCEPCQYLEGKTHEGVREAFVHRGGLRASVVEGGSVTVGDPVDEH